MEIIYLCHYFAPEVGAPSARGLEHCRRWLEQGHRVKVVTCFPNHPSGVVHEAYRGKLFRKENLEDLEVYRNYVYATPNEGFLKKTLGHLSFMFTSVLFSLPRIGKAEVIVVSSPTFFSVFSGFVYKYLKKIPLVLDVRDLWPAAIVELGVLQNKFLIKILEKIELSFYRRAEKVVVVTRRFKDNLVARGVPPHKVKIITNGVDTSFFSFSAEGRNRLRKELRLEDKFVVLYIGAHGISHALEKIIAVAERFQKDENEEVFFLFVGEGAVKAEIEKRAQELGLENVRFLPSQQKEEMPGFYSMADVCLVPLRDVKIFETFIPSKMFEMMACERPIVASLAGEAEEILKESGAAEVVGPEDVEAISKALWRLKNDIKKREAMGQKGSEYVKVNYSRQKLADDYLELLRELTS